MLDELIKYDRRTIIIFQGLGFSVLFVSLKQNKIDLELLISFPNYTENLIKQSLYRYFASLFSKQLKTPSLTSRKAQSTYLNVKSKDVVFIKIAN